MTQYRNGLQTVVAAQWNGNVIVDVMKVIGPGNVVYRRGNEQLAIRTIQAETLLVTPGDWVALDADGYQHVISDHDFKATTQPIK